MMRAPTDQDRFVYAVEFVRVVDGDTVVLDIDLGCESWMRGQHCRLIGIDTPEPHTETKAAGDAATRRLVELIQAASVLLVKTHYDKKGSFRRLLVELWADGVNVNEQLVAEGFAKRI